MQGKVEICGVNTSKLAVLDSATTRRLLLRVRQGDKSAREELIAGNLRLVLSVIQRFSSRGENIDDLFQVGCIGLIKAIDNFDAEAHDVRFSTYGVPMIAGEIRRYLRDNSALRVSRSVRDTAYKILQAREKLTAETGREPTLLDLPACCKAPTGNAILSSPCIGLQGSPLGIPRQEIALALDAISDPVSLSDPVFSDGSESLTVMDQVRDSRNTDESWIECMALDDAMRSLTGREKRILSLRFYDGKTQMEVASMVGISQAQVSRLEKNAIRQIKKAIFVS